MKSSYFQFQAFRVRQSHSAMKIGTDGVLLGAWTQLSEACETVLDIGTGTGLLSLMLAQRYVHLSLHAIEIDAGAAEEAQFNFEQSPWHKRLQLEQVDFITFTALKNRVFDHIVCNPPFYQNGYPIKNDQRNLARNHSSLPLAELFQGIASLLSARGGCSLVLPITQEKEVMALAQLHGLLLHRYTKVRGHATAPFKRMLIEFGRVERTAVFHELTLEVTRHQRTPEHQALVEAFYLPQP